MASMLDALTPERARRPWSIGSFSRQSYFGDPAFADYPVVHVDWRRAAAYCAWADARLPTEAEWEYAARGPEDRLFPWGDIFDPTRLNYCDRSCAGMSDPSYDDGFPDTAPVGSFPQGASWVGALDMAGNVREWVDDWYGAYASEAAFDPRGPEFGRIEDPRGGSWYDTPTTSAASIAALTHWTTATRRSVSAAPAIPPRRSPSLHRIDVHAFGGIPDPPARGVVDACPRNAMTWSVWESRPSIC